MNIQLESSWLALLQSEFEKENMQQLKAFLLAEKSKGQEIYPKGADIFNAFNCTPFEQVKVVILGQDPYHGAGQAHGLCFSVQKGQKIPPSLQNIYKELKNDISCTIPVHGELSKWAGQGVLLLNATLTVRANEAGSHQNRGWEQFTDTIIKLISEQKEKVVFILWGNYATAKEQLIDSSKHFVLKAAHPSPFSAYNGFFGCKHFSRANEYLRVNGKQVIDWQID